MGAKEYEYARAEQRADQRRAAWITFAAGAAQAYVATFDLDCIGLHDLSKEKLAREAANAADAMLDELDKRDFSGGG